MEKDGWIYIASNPTYHKKLKIGKTKNHPAVRVYGMSKRTEVLEDFKTEWSIKVPDINFSESLAHHVLKTYRINPKKEFFEVELDLAIEKIEKAICEYFKIENPEIYKESKENDNPNYQMPIEFGKKNFRVVGDIYYFKYRDKDEHFDILKNELQGAILEELYWQRNLIGSIIKEKDGTITAYQAIYESEYKVRIGKRIFKDELEFYTHFFNPNLDNVILNVQIKKAGITSPNEIFYRKLKELLPKYELVAEGYDVEYEYYRTNCILIQEVSNNLWNVIVITHPQKYYFLGGEEISYYAIAENGTEKDYQNLNWGTFFLACHNNDLSKYGFLLNTQKSIFRWLVANISMYVDNPKFLYKNLDKDIKKAVIESIKIRYSNKPS